VNTEILVTAGANEGIYAFETAFINEGDEVIMMEPFFDHYLCSTTFNGGVPVYVPFRPPTHSTGVHKSSEWKLDIDDLRKAITPRTKMIILNTPHNPIGKVFTEEELIQIGDLAEEFDFLILADEVYDILTFHDSKHIRIASLKNYWNRTLTVGSAGKSFSATGWRVGWCIGPAHLIQPTLSVSTRIVFCCSGPFQEATASGLEQVVENGFFEQQIKEYEERLAVIREGLDDIGLPYTVPQGSYFVLVETDKLDIPDDFQIPEMIKMFAADYRAAWFVAETAGVVSIPGSAFYCREHWHIGERFLRFAFCKDLDTLRACNERLKKLKPFIK